MPTVRTRWCVIVPTKEGSLDPELLAFLENNYARLVAGLALMSGSVPLAEDAAQEAMARAWERMDRGQHFESVTAWITVVSTNLVRSGLRRRLAEHRALARLAAGGADRGGSMTMPEEAVDVVRAIQSLPRRQREALVLHYWLEMTVVEIAAALRVSEGTVKTALSRGRHHVAQSLTEVDEVIP
jgi:RNA polymerase sigma-70 factor, ECF subfamily